jgi:hypothetical protein
MPSLGFLRYVLDPSLNASGVFVERTEVQSKSHLIVVSSESTYLNTIFSFSSPVMPTKSWDFFIKNRCRSLWLVIQEAKGFTLHLSILIINLRLGINLFTNADSSWIVGHLVLDPFFYYIFVHAGEFKV